jgi:hypothetical protein
MNKIPTSNALDSHSSLTIQLNRVPLVTLLFAILQPRTIMALQQPMLAAILPRAEAALPYNRLDLLLAFVCGIVLFEIALRQFGSHAAAEGEREV